MAPPAVTLHPRHGIHDPVHGTPPRAPGSVRRTTTIDSLRPDGLRGRLVMVGRGRDLLTGADGTPAVVADASFTMEVDYLAGRVITSITSDPGIPGLDGLCGAVAGPGFRSRLDAIAPAERDACSLPYLLLDDIPNTALVSGYTIGAAGQTATPRRVNFAAMEGQCAGYAAGATLMVEITENGRPPLVTGPEAPPLTRDDDPHAWHDLPELAPHGMRRLRRMDVAPSPDGLLTVHQHYRDVHMSGAGRPTIIHEYEVHARVVPGSWRVETIEAVPRVLPWLECPGAVPSAGRLAGRALTEVRTDVRAEFRGVSTCTHLNDQLRGLADVPALAALL